jgi:S1-C subfamily serine protease
MNRLRLRAVLAFLSLPLFLSAVVRADDRAPSCLEAVCKVSTGKNTGSGVVYRQDAERYYLLTARHIVWTTDGSVSAEVKLRFFHNGSSSANFPATVEFTSSPVDDLAVISVEKKRLEGYPAPAILPLQSYDVKESERVITIGVPRAHDDFTTWPVSMLGHVLEVPSRRTVSFLPLIQPGHSGGALVTDDGRQLVGICIERSTKLVESRAVSVFRILELLPENLK